MFGESARAGVSVTIVELMERIAPFEDEEIIPLLFKGRRLADCNQLSVHPVKKGEAGYTLLALKMVSRSNSKLSNC